jgi:hypothetical protein
MKLVFEMSYLDVFAGALFGGLIGFISSYLIWYITYTKQKADDHEFKQNRVKLLIRGCLKEIDDGIDRCNQYLLSNERNIGSPTFITTTIWDSSLTLIVSDLKNLKVLNALVYIYNKFSQINFNMSQYTKKSFRTGQNFALTYLHGIEENQKIIAKYLKSK